MSPIPIIAWIVLLNGEKEVRLCSFDSSQFCRTPTSGTVAKFWLIMLVAFVVAVLYYGLMEGRTGQTVGKRALGVRVVDMRTGNPLGVGRAIGRYVGKIVSAIPCGLGYLWMLWDPNKQTWHDKMVSSYVVTT
jgi:uncharacterized RDD family membrane protein YckC